MRTNVRDSKASIIFSPEIFLSVPSLTHKRRAHKGNLWENARSRESRLIPAPAGFSSDILPREAYLVYAQPSLAPRTLALFFFFSIFFVIIQLRLMATLESRLCLPWSRRQTRSKLLRSSCTRVRTTVKHLECTYSKRLHSYTG